MPVYEIHKEVKTMYIIMINGTYVVVNEEEYVNYIENRG